MGIRDQVRRAFYGAAIGSDIAKGLPLPSSSSFLNTATAGVATGNYATAIGAVVGNQTDLQGRSTRPYILEKHYLSGRFWTGFWYFGRCVDNNGRVIPGTANLKHYPLRAYSESTHYYGTLPLGVQGVQGRVVITGARMDFRSNAATVGSNGVGAATVPASLLNAGTGTTGSTKGIVASNVNSTSGEAITTSAAGLKLSLSQGVIATNATTTAVEAASAGTGTGSVTDGALSNLILFTSTGTLSTYASDTCVGINPVNTLITDSSGGTASTTFAALTSTVTSTVVANALAQLAANENKRLGLFGGIMAGTSAVQGLFLNLGSVTSADGAAGGSNVIEGELLLNGVVEVSGMLLGDI